LSLLAVLGSASCVPDTGPSGRGADGYRVLLDAEDARPSDGPGRATLLEAAEHDDPFLRRIAVRALGRLEDPALAPAIEARLGDPVAAVREAAAEALAQSVHRGDGGPVLEALLVRVSDETDARVRGMLARSLGRLAVAPEDRGRVERALVRLAGESAGSVDASLGVTLGFEAFVRGSGGGRLGRDAADTLESLARFGRTPGEPTEGDASTPDGRAAGHVRALALAALGGSRRMTLPLLQEALSDPEPEVRRTALTFLPSAPPSAREILLAQALADGSPRVLIGALRWLEASPRSETACQRLVAAAEPDRPAGVRVVALSALSRPCPFPEGQRETLLRAVAELGQPEAPWQPAAAALVSLAALEPERAARVLAPFVVHESPFVRTHAARAAAASGAVATLSSLSMDPSANVRAEAARGRFAVEGHALDAFLLEQLQSDDPQLLMTVSELLEGAPDRQPAALSLLAAFERISRAERETWRDARLALLERIRELGDGADAQLLLPFLRDYDSAVASAVAGVLEAWTGDPHTAEPTPLPRFPVPGLAEMRDLDDSSLLLHMQGGDVLVIDLLAEQAPTNVARLTRLARAGYFDGLTFHRWVPNFVIQGGSPGANEYQGDGPYSRDEVGGTPHWRGTVGLSTRGRDTGDAQIFVNLIDNVRLDYDYTVMGMLTGDDEVLDDILEGAVIERAEVVSGR